MRGGISSQRTTAIAGIAFGLPIVAYSGPMTGFPVTEAGVVVAPYGDYERLSQALVCVLGDEHLQHELRQRSQVAYQKYFSWDSIAAQYLKILR
jgi:glycosyltransferase involved in cell wall biosynthesis